MSILTSFYKKLVTISFFRNKAKTQLVRAVTEMDRMAQIVMSEPRQYWLNTAKKEKNFKLKPGAYKADLIVNNEVFPECVYFFLLNINNNNTFSCTRKFHLDDLDFNDTWEGKIELQGQYLHLDADFCFKDTVITSDGPGTFMLTMDHRHDRNIKFCKLNHKDKSMVV